MIHPGLITANIVEEVAFLAATPVLWLFLYLLAWVDPERARAAGFGRTTFWLLVGGGVVGLLGELPILPIGPYVLGINVAGGIIPLVLSGLFLARLAPNGGSSARLFVLLLALETAIALVGVIVLPSLGVPVVLAATVALAIVGYLVLPKGPTGRFYAAALALVSGAIAVTFLSTQSEPGYGITSQFPFYFFAPIGVGVLSVALAEVLRLDGGGPVGRGAGLPLAYATTTLGVLVGADVLRQPPLYGSGSGGFYVIGGAGPLDLLYLSGLIAVASAWTLERLLHGRWPAAPSDTPTVVRTPEDVLRNSLDIAMGGDPAAAVRLAGEAADSSVDRARLLLEAPPAPPETPWAGLPVPAWVDLDHRNLRALVNSPERRPRDAARAWWTARWLVRLGGEIGRRRFARAGARFVAGTVDVLALAVPAILVWVLLVVTSKGSGTALLNGAAYNAAAVGYAAWAFVYFVVAEAWFGTTLGKRLVGLAVTDRSLRRPAVIPAMLRNAPKLLPLIVVGVVGADLVYVALRGAAALGVAGTSYFPDLAVVTALTFLVLIGVGIPTAAGALTMSMTSERQRLGDLLAGTWVVTARRPTTAVPPGAGAPSVVPPGA
ncbi:MAG TPA: RDD family protein [Thermoplasmata archaeon]|jgi:uncharacterized RDD family membrane protein YckC|nr:RDD family protein [Thermoplasmata archaeon]